MTSATDTVHGVTYAQNTFYTPPGELASATFGSAVQTDVYSPRLQPCWTYVTAGTPLPTSTACSGSAAAGTLLDLKYNFGLGVNDNGNLQGITNNGNTGFSKIFGYDSLNRIQSYQTTASNLWSVIYTIDPWGNLTNKTPQSGYGGESLNTPPTLKNQFLGFSYDTAGNMTNDGRFGYTFNAENQIVSANGVTFTYNGDGERVQKSEGTIYWGGGSGGALVESDNSGTPKAEYIFFNGKRIARRDLPSGNIRYYFADHLGSATVVADASGNTLEQYDYAPYGELHWSSGSDSNHYLFTGKERDSSGLDYFGARYYGNSLGRWLSPDWAAKPTTVPYAQFGDPQSLNLYGYVGNNPVGSADADGHCAANVQGSPNPDPCNKYAQPAVNDGGPGVTTSTTQTAAKAQQTSLVADILNIVEVSGSAGIGSHYEFQAGTVEFSGGYNLIGVEGTTGLAGGNANGTILTGVQGNASVPGAGVEVKAGAELSTKDGATLSATATGHAGPLSGEVKADSTGVHASSKAGANHDVKLGGHAQLGLGVGVTVNLSQAARAAQHFAQSLQDFGSAVYNHFIPNGLPW